LVFGAFSHISVDGTPLDGGSENLVGLLPVSGMPANDRRVHKTQFGNDRRGSGSSAEEARHFRHGRERYIAFESLFGNMLK
jgi:hypothetical protein